MQSEKCPEYVRLQAEVEAVLEKLTQLTSFQLNAFRASDQAEFMRADKELELTVGIKERANDWRPETAYYGTPLPTMECCFGFYVVAALLVRILQRHMDCWHF